MTLLRTLAALIFLASSATAYTLRDRVTAREVDESTCAATPRATTFLPSSANRAYVWFNLSSVLATDEFQAEWIQPAGTVYRRVIFNRISGNRCYWAYITPRSSNLPQGNWSVRVTANGQALFTLAFRLGPLAEACPSTTLGQGTVISQSLADTDCHLGEVLGNSDERYVRRFQFTATGTGVLRLDLTSTAFDAYLYLLNASGRVIETDDDDGDGRNAMLIRQLEPGVYTVLVTSYTRDTGAFRLVSAWQDPRSCGSTTLELDIPISEALRTSDCSLRVFVPSASARKYARAFRLTLPQAGELTIDLRSTDFDTYLYLLDEQYRGIERDDDGGNGPTNSLIRRNVRAGTYLLIATSYSDYDFGRFNLRASLAGQHDVITLYLHGLNSDSGAWDDVNADNHENACVKTDAESLSGPPVTSAPCYLYTFSAREAEGEIWAKGDGADFAQLGTEVGAVVEWIRRRHSPRILVLAGHSRGGLAARAYLQSLPARLPFRVGLVTIGTPHRGSPFGRVRQALLDRGKKLADEHCSWLSKSKIRFAFAPATGFLSTAHDADKTPSLTDEISKPIRDLNQQAFRLNQVVDLLGEVRSAEVPFGKNVGDNPYDRDEADIHADKLIRCISSSDQQRDEILEFIQLNLPASWLEKGDGVVPFESQQLRLVPGVTKFLWSIDLPTATPHVNETQRTGAIKLVIDKIVSELRAMPAMPSSSAPQPMANPPEPDRHTPTRLLSLRQQFGPQWDAAVQEAEAAIDSAAPDRALQLGLSHLNKSPNRQDPQAQLAYALLLAAGNEKAVQAIVESITPNRGWSVASAESIAADLARLPIERTREALSALLATSPLDSPATAVAASALARSGEPAGVEALLEWARHLSGPLAAESATLHLEKIASQRAIRFFKKSVHTMSFTDEAVRRAALDTLARLDVEVLRLP